MPREEQSREQGGEGGAGNRAAKGWLYSPAVTGMRWGMANQHPHPSCLGLLSSPTETSRPHVVTPKPLLLPKVDPEEKAPGQETCRGGGLGAGDVSAMPVSR